MPNVVEGRAPEVKSTPAVVEALSAIGFELAWSLRVLAVILSGKTITSVTLTLASKRGL